MTDWIPFESANGRSAVFREVIEELRAHVDALTLRVQVLELGQAEQDPVAAAFARYRAKRRASWPGEQRQG